MQTSVIPDLEAIKTRQQKTWASGAYARVGNTLVLMSERLCKAAGVSAGQKVLDVFTGSGSTALSAARHFAQVTGLDYVPGLLQQASERAKTKGLGGEFEEGDAENLPFPEAHFDATLSTVGAMFAPNQEKTAAELLRVTKPGGKIGLVSRTPAKLPELGANPVFHYLFFATDGKSGWAVGKFGKHPRSCSIAPTAGPPGPTAPLWFAHCSPTNACTLGSPSMPPICG